MERSERDRPSRTRCEPIPGGLAPTSCRRTVREGLSRSPPCKSETFGEIRRTVDKRKFTINLTSYIANLHDSHRAVLAYRQPTHRKGLGDLPPRHAGNHSVHAPMQH